MASGVIPQISLIMGPCAGTLEFLCNHTDSEFDNTARGNA